MRIAKVILTVIFYTFLVPLVIKDDSSELPLVRLDQMNFHLWPPSLIPHLQALDLAVFPLEVDGLAGAGADAFYVTGWPC